VCQSAIALMDDKDLGALKAMTPQKKGRLTKARMEPIVDFSLNVLIPGSMSLLRPEPANLTSPPPLASRPPNITAKRSASSPRSTSSMRSSRKKP
jgi:hypothetical protein